MMKLLLILLSFNFLLSEELNIKYEEKPTSLIIQGKPENTVNDLLIGNIQKEEILKLRKEELETRKIIQQPLKDYIIQNQEIKYKKGMVIDINTLHEIPVTLEFFDTLQNKINFKYISPGSPYFTIEKDNTETNRLFVTASQKFRNGILTLGIEGFEMPIVLRFNENSDKDVYSTYNKIILETIGTNNKSNTTVVDNYKRRILKQTIDLDNFDLLPSVRYELWTLDQRKLSLLSEDAMNIYYIDNDSINNKGFYVLILHKYFKLEGYEKLMFSNYKDNYQVFMLNFNTNVFTIRNHETKERYRVVIK